MTTLEIVLLAGLIVLIGHFIKGFSGFASALFAIPLLALFLDIRFVVPVFLLFDLIGGAVMTIQNRRFIQWKTTFVLLVGLAVGTAIGTYFLVSFGNEALRRIFGAVVILFVLKILIWENQDIRKEIRSLWAPVSGFIGGCTGGMFGLDGPPLVLYLARRLSDRRIFRATLYGIFFVDACYRLILYTASGLVTWEVINFALYLTPFLLIGLFLGSRLHAKINENLFRKIIAVILLVTGSFLMM
jgi:uncharacterized membrane protein YfcA